MWSKYWHIIRKLRNTLGPEFFSFILLCCVYSEYSIGIAVHSSPSPHMSSSSHRNQGTRSDGCPIKVYVSSKNKVHSTAPFSKRWREWGSGVHVQQGDSLLSTKPREFLAVGTYVTSSVTEMFKIQCNHFIDFLCNQNK